MGVVVSALEVIEAGFGVVDVAPVAQGVVGAQRAGHGTADGKGLAPGIVGIGDYCCTGSIQDRRDIALQVGDIVVSCTVVGYGHGHTAGIVGKIQRIPIHRHLAQLAAVVDIAICRAAVGPFGPHALGIVGEGPGGASTGHSGQLPAMLPGISPLSVTEDIANSIAGDGVSVISGKQIAPGIVVAVGLGGGGSAQGSGGAGILLLTEDIARIIIAPGPALPCPLIVLRDQPIKKNYEKFYSLLLVPKLFPDDWTLS